MRTTDKTEITRYNVSQKILTRGMRFTARWGKSKVLFTYTRNKWMTGVSPLLTSYKE